MKKIRIDDYLVKHKYFDSKDTVKRYVMAGKVFVNQNKITSSALMYKVEDIKEIRISAKKRKYVSRAGEKLEHALNYWKIDLKGKTMLDVGASTGGFTDCALQNGIKEVAALDVGTNQLDYKIRIKDNVKVYEQTNFRTIDDNFFDDKFDFITMDVSFISVKLLIDNVKNFLKKDGVFICLIKPQFEASRDLVKENSGIILDKTIHKEIIEDIKMTFEVKGLKVFDVIPSHVIGTKGNQEYLAYVKLVR